MVVSKNYFRYIFMVIYSLLIVGFPWESSKNSAFIDRENYYNYFKYGENRLDHLDFNSITDFFKNEWLWHFFIRYLTNIFQLESIFFIISFLLLFSFFIFIYKNTNIYYVFLGLNPLVVDLMYSQLRMSLALVFFIWAIIFYKKHKIICLILLLFSLFTHTAIFPILIIYIYSFFIAHKDISLLSKSFLATLCGFVFSIIFGPLRERLLIFIGDRRSEYNDDVLSSSFLYLSYWVLLLFIYYFNLFVVKPKIDNKNVFFAVSMLSLVFMNLFLGGYSTRILALSMPFILILIYNLKGFYKIIMIHLYILYVCIYFYIWW